MGTATAAMPMAAMIRRHCSPARNKAKPPDAATSMPVPKSGCFTISKTGKPTMTALTASVFQLGGNVSR